MNPFKINLDYKQDCYEEIKVSMLDTVKIEATITDNWQAVDLTGANIQMQIGKNDNRYVIQTSNITVVGNKVSITLDEQATVLDGITELTLVINKNTERKGLWIINLSVRRTSVSNKVDSITGVPLLQDIENSIIDAGISKAALDNAKNNLDISIANGDTATMRVDIDNHSEQLAEKARQVDVDNSLTLKRDKTTPIGSTDVSDELMLMFSPGGTVNPVISDKAISPIKTSFLPSATINLFDSSKAVTTGFINSTTGAISIDATGYMTSDFIEVVPGSVYSTNANAPSGYYNSAKVFVQAIAYNATKPYTVPTGLDIKYIRISCFSPAYTSVMRIFLGSTLLPWVAYDNSFKLSSNIKLVNESIGKIIDIENCTFIQKTGDINLFNKATSIDNSYPNGAGLTTDVAWESTDYIPVDVGKTYIKNGGANVLCVYDVNKVNIFQGNVSSVTIPTGGKYIRCGIYKSDKTIDTFMVVEGTSLPSYVPYVEVNVFSGIKLPNPTIPLSWWSGKKADVLGDSITFMNLWQPIVTSKLGLTFANHGVSGTKVSGILADAMFTDARVNSLSTDADIYIVMGGINDWAGNTPLEVINKLDTTTFKGAYRVLIEKLITKFPNKHVVVMTNTFGTVPARAGWTDQLGIINNLGLSTMDYAKATREVCLEYGVPVIDINAESYINKINILQFITDEGNMIVHPNASGAERMAEIAVGKLKQIEPI